MILAKGLGSILLLITVSAAVPAAGPQAGRDAQEPRRYGESVAATESSLLRQGITDLQAGRTAAATAAFKRVLAADPNSFEAHTYLGVIADQHGRLSEAERHFLAAVRTAPDSPNAHNNYGAISVRLGKRAAAVQHFTTSLRLNPQQRSALVNLAKLYAETGRRADLKQASELFDRAWAIAPDAEIARASLMLALTLRDADQATSRYEAYRAQLPSAPIAVTDSAARLQVAAALHQSGLAAQAEQELGDVLSGEPDDMQAVALLGKVLLSQNRIPAAGKLLETQVARGMATAPIYAALADVYQRSGHIENAIPAMREATERAPSSEAYRLRYGLLLIDTKAPAAAVIRMKETVERFPKSARSWFVLGLSYFNDNKNQDAAKAFDRAIELDPKYAPALAYRGMTLVEIGDYKQAVIHYQRALVSDPDLAAVHYLAAEALTKQNISLEKAEAHLKRSLAIDPNFARASLFLGKLYLREGRLEPAAREFEKAIKLEPEMAEGYYQLGRTYTRLKQADKARETLATYERLNKQQREDAVTERQELVRRLAKVNF